MDIEKLEQFSKMKDQKFKLTKVGSKRDRSMVGVGQFETGGMDLIELNVNGEIKPAVIVYGRGFHYLRTSPVVSIVESDEKSIKFETEGGVYLLEKI